MLPSNQKRVIEQTKFAYSSLGFIWKKKNEDQGIKQFEALKALKPEEVLKALKPEKKSRTRVNGRTFSKKYKHWWN